MIKTVWTYIIYLLIGLGTVPLISNLVGGGIEGAAVKFSFLFLGVLLLFHSNKDIRRLFIQNTRNKNLKAIIVALIAFFLIGVITGGNVGNVLMDFMAILFFSYFYCFSIKKEKERAVFEDFTEKLFEVIAILEFIGIYREIYQYEDLEKVNVVICSFFTAMVAMKNGKYIKSLLFVAVLVYMVIMDAMRVNYLFIILYVLYAIYLAFDKKSFSIKKIFFTILLAIGVFYSIPRISSFIMDDAQLRNQMIGRMEGFMEGDVSGEEIRINSNLVVFKEPEYFLLPRGLGWQNHTFSIQKEFRSRYGIKSTMDSNLFYCCYHFGIIIGLWVIIAIALRLVRGIVKGIKQLSDRMTVLKSCMLLCILFMVLLNSWIFVYSSFGIVYGILLAYSYSSSKTKQLLANG